MVAIPKWLKNSQWEGQQPTRGQSGLCLREMCTRRHPLPTHFIIALQCGDVTWLEIHRVFSAALSAHLATDWAVLWSRGFLPGHTMLRQVEGVGPI